MSKKSFFYTILTGFSVAAWLYHKCRKDRVHDTVTEKETLTVKIDRDNDGIWRILDKFDQNKGTLEVRRGNTVQWLTNKSDVEFSFSQDVANFFRTGPALFKDGHSQRIKKGESLQVTVKSTAPVGELIYKVHVVDADEDVVRQSPPIMIIRL